MFAGKIKGLFCYGQNPAVGGPNSNMERAALHKLDWLVSVDLFETETSIFWKRPGVNPSDVDTEVFLLPAAASMEKEGSVSNSGRMVQWRYKAVEPPEMAKSDAWIVDRLIGQLKKLYASGGAFPDPILRVSWNYGSGEEPDPHMIAKENNGYFLKDTAFPDKNKFFKKGDQVPGFAWLTDDGSTACGNWILCGSYTNDGNMAARRSREDAPNKLGLFPKWAWCWPVNRRILYNRASVNMQGVPRDPNRWVIRWNEEKKAWEGDVPDGPWPPGEKLPFIMRPEGVAGLFSSGVEEGPFPEHYEPVESPVRNLMNRVQFNPAVKIWDTPDVDKLGTSDQFPIVATTYRVSEHWQAGSMTRNMPWLVELMPDVFVEIGTDLARRKGIKNGDRVLITSARGEIEVYALVTERFEPFWVAGRLVDEVGIIWHYGYAGLAQGDSANVLTPHVGDANTMIPEYKAFLVDVRKKEVA
jgi:formate dehydrogenase major subunit